MPIGVRNSFCGDPRTPSAPCLVIHRRLVKHRPGRPGGRDPRSRRARTRESLVCQSYVKVTIAVTPSVTGAYIPHMAGGQLIAPPNTWKWVCALALFT
jgi:hypothetical protein